MSWKVWKGKDKRAEEEREKAENLRNQERFEDSARSFRTAAGLYGKSNNNDEEIVCLTYATLYNAVSTMSSQSFIECSQMASTLKGETVLNLPKDVKAETVANECNLISKYIHLRGSFDQLDSEGTSLAASYESLANEVAVMPDEHFELEDLGPIKNLVVDGRSSISFRLRGLAEMVRGNAQVLQDPAGAKDRFDSAKTYFTMANSGPRNEMEERTKRLGLLGKCWFCHREVVGEDYHFVYLDTNLSMYVQNRFEKERALSFSDDQVVACVPCSGALSRIAERIARMYYEKAIGEINALREELVSEIERIKDRLSSVERRPFR